MIGLDEAKKAWKLPFCNQPGRTAPVVAEHGFGLMFALAKRAAFLTMSMKEGGWPRMDNIYLQGKNFGNYRGLGISEQRWHALDERSG